MAADKFEISINPKEFLAAAKKLPAKMERKVYRGAVSRSATPILKKARSLTTSQTVRKALTKRARNKARDGYFSSIITVKSGVFRSKRTARRRGKGAVYSPDEAIRYYRFLELGTKYHAARPFLKPALDSSEGEVESKLRNELWRGIIKVAK